MRHLLPILPLPDLFDRFLAARHVNLTPRTYRAYTEILDDLTAFLRARRITGVPCDPAYGVPSLTSEAERLGQLHREQRAALDAFVEVTDDFAERHVVANVGAEREYVRLAQAMIRDLARWLRTSRLAPPAAAHRSHLAVVRGRGTSPRTAAGRPRPGARPRPALGAGLA